MHALRAFIEDQMQRNQWTQADLSRQSGLSRQHLSKMLADSREQLPQLPDRSTLLALANGLHVAPSVVVLRAAMACGIPVEVTEVEVPSASALSTDQLLAEVRRRIEVGSDERAAPIKGAGQAGHRPDIHTPTAAIELKPRREVRSRLSEQSPNVARDADEDPLHLAAVAMDDDDLLTEREAQQEGP